MPCGPVKLTIKLITHSSSAFSNEKAQTVPVITSSYNQKLQEEEVNLRENIPKDKAFKPMPHFYFISWLELCPIPTPKPINCKGKDLSLCPRTMKGLIFL